MIPQTPEPQRGRLPTALGILTVSLIPLALGILHGDSTGIGAGALACYLLAFVLSGRLRE